MRPASRATGWSRPLRRELTHQLHHNRRRFAGLLLLGLLLSAASALLLWRSHRDQWVRQQDRQIQTQLGLLELRVNQHRTTVLDWGHWDAMQTFAAGRDPGFVARELTPSSIVADQQVLIALTREGRRLLLRSDAGAPIASPLLACIQQRVQRLRQLTARAARDRAFGLYCHVGRDVVIGAGTGIRPSAGGTPEEGWLIHFSRLERPSYNEGLNRAFRDIDRALVPVRQPVTAAAGQPVAAISELLPPGEQFLLRPALTPLQLGRRAAAQTLPAWMGINLLLLALLPALLLLNRQRRLTETIRSWQDRRAVRKRRQRISTQLLNRRHLLMAFSADPPTLVGSWIAALRFSPPPGRWAEPPVRREWAFQNLVQTLQQELHPPVMGWIDPRTLLLVFPGSDQPAHQVRERLARLLEQAEAAPTPGGGIACRGCLAQLQASRQVEQVLELHAVVAQLPAGRSLELLSDAIGEHAGLLRAPRPGLSPAPPQADGLVRLDPVIQLLGDQRRLVYHALRFAEAAEPPGGDRLMIHQLLALLRQRQGTAAGAHFGVRLTLTGPDPEAHVAAILEMLEPLPAVQRSRLVFELAEMELMRQPDLFAPLVRRLHGLGARIAVEEFGAGPVPIQQVFELRPAFLKLSADYGPQLHDEAINTMVDFLLSYCRYKGCRLVLKGVDTPQQMLHWQRKGVTFFEGRVFRPESRRRPKPRRRLRGPAAGSPPGTGHW